MQVFLPPVAFDNPAVLPETRGLQRRLFRHFQGRARGRSVIKVGEAWRVVDYPDQLAITGLVDGLTLFVGGHEYLVSDTLALELIGAGFGGISPVPDSGYGQGGYGSGGYGA